MKQILPDLHSLTAQMILSSLGLVLLMAGAAGIPAVWLIRQQLEQQVAAQVDQGRLAAQALYRANQNELAGLATLTAQRPTLQQLLVDGRQDALAAYLSTLQAGSGLDLVAVCESGQAVAWSGTSLGERTTRDLCAAAVPSGFAVVSQEPVPQVWLLASHPLSDSLSGEATNVTVGTRLDHEFAAQMRMQTGLEHTLLVDGKPVATSLPTRMELDTSMAGQPSGRWFYLNGQSYYSAWFRPDGSGLLAEVALDVTDMAMTQRRLLWTLGGSILAVALVASLLGTYLARRIGRPLFHLADAAQTMSKGNLDEPLAIDAGVREVALVAQALERARVDLKGSLAELRQEKAWSDHLLAAIVEGIVTLDRRGRITFFSQGAERITGWHRHEVMGQSCDEVFLPIEAGEPFSQLIPPPGRRRKISVELRDGREATLAITGAQLLPPERKDARVALVFRDVSEEEAVHRLLGHFLANVAHEFRTPLSSLAASVELLLDQAEELTPKELEELLTSLHLGVLGLQTLIDNLLEGASIEAGRFRIQPHSSHLRDIIGTAIATMQPLFDKHEQRLTLELPAMMPLVHADPRRIAQVLVNLLSNASKYGPDDAEIELGATVGENSVRVTVADSGPGIPAGYRRDLFRRFVHPSWGNDRAQVGVGLGLSVVKAIVEAHGGRVGVEDRAGRGSIFWFTLPLSPGSE
jgi:PAS domain S-box-containing protein